MKTRQWASVILAFSVSAIAQAKGCPDWYSNLSTCHRYTCNLDEKKPMFNVASKQQMNAVAQSQFDKSMQANIGNYQNTELYKEGMAGVPGGVDQDQLNSLTQYTTPEELMKNMGVDMPNLNIQTKNRYAIDDKGILESIYSVYEIKGFVGESCHIKIRSDIENEGDVANCYLKQNEVESLSIQTEMPMHLPPMIEQMACEYEDFYGTPLKQAPSGQAEHQYKGRNPPPVVPKTYDTQEVEIYKENDSGFEWYH